MTSIFSPLILPNGSILANRIAKAAMEEGLAGPGQLPDKRVLTLYRRWGHGGAGLLITGNVMVDARALTGPGGIVLAQDTPLRPFTAWADAAKAGDADVWMQINHPGRQANADMPGVCLAPSAVAVDVGAQSKRFAAPTPMTEADIEDVIGRFVTTAVRAEQAGFDGVQVHAAHGYLLSQFLSPLTNRRIDEWGGPLENRARALTRIITGIRESVSPSFAVAVKLNSADFQRGGFALSDAVRLVGMLNTLGVDAVEVSGGSYESPAMQGRPADDRTLAREAYFLEFAEDLLGVAKMPLILTGGIRRREVAQKVIDRGIAVAGLGTALATVPDLPLRWRDVVAVDAPELKPIEWKDKALGSAARIAQVRYQLHRLAAGREPRPGVLPGFAFALDQLRRRRDLKEYSAWLSGPRSVEERGAKIATIPRVS
ncbi:NADH:flavin oxidoreductase/NADH oxidase family protein [Nocardia sp. BSTN01]|uniref:NADH:flavin oxidoreductase/NADH oxidase family protein n=1 Tax=Nocardia sp. BSTN01 TaxID=2783665 RepID=UPI00188E29BB|nr:NADH:flavin oxidoreductase/NADH oxidase family protein [Nocardia sp. BSTN01]MBF4997410.1 NADH:flavin oxidoreductase/NADH oxidase family protein [Nocardia sp. BSTN01]